MHQSEAVPVTLAEIARLAGVGRAAVSNWRRRHDSFPAPIGGTDVSPQFSLTEIEEWLRGQGKLHEGGGRERLWPQFDALGDRSETGLAIAKTALSHDPRGATLLSEPKFDLPRAAQQLVDQTTGATARVGVRETFDFLLGRWLDTHVRQVSSTPRELAMLMAEVAQRLCMCDDSTSRTVLDPACGTGGLLSAAVEVLAGGQDLLTLAGVEKDPVLAALAVARLSLGVSDEVEPQQLAVDVRTGDSLRADPQAELRAHMVLCNPPFNERDWGHEELATDPRWSYGLPPRTEPELAWVQHALSRLHPGGAAVLVLPPSAAARKAGRSIRRALLRAGALRAVVALPPGSAAPHSVALHLWVLGAGHASRTAANQSICLIDAAGAAIPGRGIDWTTLSSEVKALLGPRDDVPGPPIDESEACTRSVVMSSIDLLDEEVDLTPARHVPVGLPADSQALGDIRQQFSARLADLHRAYDALSVVDRVPGPGTHRGTTTVGELVRAGVLDLYTGHLPAETSVRTGFPGADDVPVMTVPDVMSSGRPGGWIPRQEAIEAGLTVSQPDDVIVVGVTRAFSAWVELGSATALGPQLYALRADPEALDSWFLAGCLRAPANGRQAGTHASSSARVDVRKLQVPQMPLDEQRRHGDIFRQIVRFERELGELGRAGETLVRELNDGLAGGRLARTPLEDDRVG
ncbi:N-6 DNA methylase [Nocardia stercoris]|uniref:N-6 DNA methylase n=1 Tax=Nocardia stercoris TaxID=2483361 RepID=A0A3M2L4S5_9NOCA|nr:N-6 DNA methylase [Nocardia stercoris]RMI32692.1 N-6 DNA methylase [Nocardia stercoris]